MSQPNITLHTYFRSSCSARVRIALNLKGLTFTPHYIHLVKSEQCSPEYTSINPSATVPTITFTQDEESQDSFVLTQSMAILEYLEEKFPPPAYTPLLPTNPEHRARVRQLCNIIACDIQPLTNLKMLKSMKEYAKAAGQDPDVAGPEWQKKIMTEGFRAYEAICKKSVGKYSVGDELSMADVCLMPAIDGAVRFGVDMEEFETVKRVWSELDKVEAVVKGGWRVQGDTPADLRA
ncbi:hypothetical protein H072_2748 [Dactylellina haptotyla CBS 200.50]|uniref:Maleylacetoacetate isomerase n=1 Tax=Dactylellina haptotyla (strain CBS 200.50) TaxID=1284197 RepID=S8AQ96_DACHA|nr:hypothetical protein H072_2748 [Dactylellina haptotyla CBS 200.50]